MKLLSDGSDLLGVKKSEDIEYLKLVRLSMRPVALWPRDLDESKLHRYYMITLKSSTLIAGIIYIKDNIGKLSHFELGHTYITVFMNAVGVTRGILMLTDKYNTLGKDFLNTIHLFNHKDNSEYAHKTHILLHKICHFYTIYTLCMMWNGLILFNVTPFFNSFTEGMFSKHPPENSTFEHAVYYTLPFDYKRKMKGYVAVAIFNWYISYVCSAYFCIVDLFISLMVFHLWGHIRILIYNLNNFPLPASVLADSSVNENNGENKRYTEEESRDISLKLREYIHHHTLIINFVSRMSATFGEVILVYYLFHQVSGCLLLLECSQMDTKALARYGLLTLIVFQQLIQVSVIFELLGSSNDKLIDAVYTLPWEYMETKHRKLVFFMLKQSQQSINLKAMNMITVGVQTMTAILKTSFSYFVMLRTVADEE